MSQEQLLLNVVYCRHWQNTFHFDEFYSVLCVYEAGGGFLRRCLGALLCILDFTLILSLDFELLILSFLPQPYASFFSLPMLM